jgi:DNA adenine methylase
LERNELKPLISYYGGKQRLAAKILQYFPPHSVYVEPFAGGAALLFAKPVLPVTNTAHYCELLNDTSDLLINMYRVAIERRDEFALKIQATLFSQSDHRRAKTICKQPEEHNELDRAWAYYVSIQFSFSRILGAAWVMGMHFKNKAATHHQKKLRIQSTLDRLSCVAVSCDDAIRCIKRNDSPQTLFYCDPPYPNARQGHYRGYTLEHWEELCDALDNAKGSYVLSNYAQPIEPKSAQQRIEMKASMCARNKATASAGTDYSRTEILWVCDRSPDARQDLQPVLKKNRQLMLENW